MPGLSETDLAQYVYQLTDATVRGIVPWATANPTTYVWDKIEKPKARVSLQQVQRKQFIATKDGRRYVNVDEYILQVYEVAAEGRIVLREQIDGGESAKLNQMLEVLFTHIRTEKVQKDLDFLKGTLPEQG